MSSRSRAAFSNSSRRAGLLHLLLHLRDQPVLLAFHHQPQFADLLAVFFLRHAEVARGRALADAVQQAGAEPAPAVVVGADVQRAGAELEEALQHLHRLPQGAGAGERAVELDALSPRRPRELDARKFFSYADLQIGKGLVVLQLDVETRLHVLDEPRFEEQGVHLAVGRQEIDVGDELDEVGGARVLGRGLGEIVPGAVAQVLGLADVEDYAAGRPSSGRRPAWSETS